MAEDESTADRRSRNTARESEFERLRAENRRRHERELARRWHASQALGERIKAAVTAALPKRKRIITAREQRLERLYAELLDAAVTDTAEPVIIERAPRSKAWRGPHHGESFSEPEALKTATLEECRAGYAATWGYEINEMDLEVFRLVHAVPERSADVEREAREIYTELRRSSERARNFAHRYYNNTHGAAGLALAALWEHLPALPLVEDLPGYVKRLSPYSKFVEEAQSTARTVLGWELDRRELAELHILVAPDGPPYRELLRRSTKMKRRARYVSVSDVIEWESKNLDRGLSSRRNPRGPDVEESVSE